LKKLGKYMRIAYLTEDAVLYGDSVQLKYKRRGHSSLGSGPSTSKCPPVESLKKGTRIKITYTDKYLNQLLKVEIA